MIDEMICAFDSPGSVSAVLIIALLFRESDKCARGRYGPPTTEMCRAGFTLSGAPNWLAAESVSATKCLPPRCKTRMHAQCQCRKTNKCREQSFSWVRAYVECHNDCPAIGMMPGCGRNSVRSVTQHEKPALRKSMKLQPRGTLTSRF
jgi:hypothetical protein